MTLSTDAKQNVTLAIPKSLLKEAKIIAVKRDTSLSKLLATYIAEIVKQDSDEERLKAEALALLDQGFNMGTNGKATWTRDELHERR